MAEGTGAGETLDGTVERIVFRNEGNGWTVMRLTVQGEPLLRTVVGSFQRVEPGERVRLTGEWTRDAKHGRQFRAVTCLPLAPETLKGIEKFLGSGLIPGVGPVMAKRLVDRFGLETLDVIESSASRLTEVEGIGAKRARAVSRAMREKREVKDVMVFLESAGVSPVFAHRIYKRYGKDSIRLVSENPYRLAMDVHGIGFLSADRIASHLGVLPDSQHRAEAGILHALEELAGEGNVFGARDEVVRRASSLLEIDIEPLERAVERLILMGGVRVDGEGADAGVYLPRLHRAESAAARDLAALLSTPAVELPVDARSAAARAERLSGIELAPMQRGAFDALAEAKVMVLTGGPGTGKTTLLKGIVACLADSGLSVLLAAPTGRAARRMAQSAGMDARTIHRLLEFNPRNARFDRNRSNPLEAQVVVVDEVSMVDVELFSALVSAIRPDARMVLVGDPDQLPSVGPGTVLTDLLRLGRRGVGGLKVVRLTEIFRQARSSLIVTGAHDVLSGREPRVGDRGQDADLFMVERDDPAACLEAIVELVTSRIPRRFGLDPIDGSQVLTPMHKGILGASNINERLQEILNPGEGGVPSRGIFYRAGDKVMQVRNNYDLEVFNGDIGRVTGADRDAGWLEIEYSERTVRYPSSELDQITLAYACSVHKSQGSEYPAVVIPLHTQHYVMLQRNLLYTALTRGKRLVVLVGTRRAVGIAVRNSTMRDRRSALARRVLEDV